MKLRRPSQVKEMTAQELHEALVDDFANFVYPETLVGLQTQVAALRKIAETRGQTLEAAFIAVQREAASAFH